MADADPPQTARLTLRIFPSPDSAGTCEFVDISDETTVADLKLSLAKKHGYEPNEIAIKLRMKGAGSDGSKHPVLENQDAKVWDYGVLRTCTMPVHLGVFMNWDGMTPRKTRNWDQIRW
jgi:hypothetical protein